VTCTGSQYFRAPTPEAAEWERDIRQAKEYGLDWMRFRLMWSWYSRGGGQYDFSSLHRLMGICADHEMKALMLVNLESAPAWLVKKHPEAIYEDAHGRLDPLSRPDHPDPYGTRVYAIR
jgi:beta-galactosidase